MTKLASELSLELGYEALTLKEAKKVVSSLLEVCFDHSLDSAHTKKILSYNYRRIFLKNINASKITKIQELISSLDHILPHKLPKWWIIFSNEEIVHHGPYAHPTTYGRTLLDKIKVESFTHYLQAMHSRDIGQEQSFTITLNGFRKSEITYWENLITGISTWERVDQVYKLLNFNGFLEYWYHYAYSNRCVVLCGEIDLTVLGAQDKEELTAAYQRKVLDSHHSIKTFIPANSQKIICLIALAHHPSPEISTKIKNLWMGVLKKRCFTFYELYKSSYRSLRVEQLKVSTEDLVSSYLFSNLVTEQQDIKEAAQIRDGRGHLDGLTPYTLLRLHESAHISLEYPQLQEYITCQLYADLIKDNVLSHPLHKSVLDLFQKMHSSSRLFKTIALSVAIAKKVTFHQISSIKKLKNDPYQIRPLLKDYFRHLDHCDVSITTLETYWEKAIPLSLASSQQVESIREVHHRYFNKIQHKIDVLSPGRIEHLDLGERDNPLILNSLLKLLGSTSSTSYLRCISMRTRLQKLVDPTLKGESSPSKQEHDILEMVEHCDTALLEHTIDKYLQDNLIRHSDPAIARHRNLFLQEIIKKLKARIKDYVRLYITNST